jgi:hypothetical protein
MHTGGQGEGATILDRDNRYQNAKGTDSDAVDAEGGKGQRATCLEAHRENDRETCMHMHRHALRHIHYQRLTNDTTTTDNALPH